MLLKNLARPVDANHDWNCFSSGQGNLQPRAGDKSPEMKRTEKQSKMAFISFQAEAQEETGNR